MGARIFVLDRRSRQSRYHHEQECVGSRLPHPGILFLLAPPGDTASRAEQRKTERATFDDGFSGSDLVALLNGPQLDLARFVRSWNRGSSIPGVTVCGKEVDRNLPGMHGQRVLACSIGFRCLGTISSIPWKRPNFN